MARYHMKKDGTPGVCNAQPGNCPLGGNENHVEAETLEQAQQQFDNKNEDRVRQLDYLSKELDGNLEDYSQEEQDVFMNVKYDDSYASNLIEFDNLPSNLKHLAIKRSGKSEEELNKSTIIVEHINLEATKKAAEDIDLDTDDYVVGLGSSYNFDGIEFGTGIRGVLLIE